MGYQIHDKTIPCVINDFQFAGSDTEKQDIVTVFCNNLWSIEPQARTSIKTICHEVPAHIHPELSSILARYQPLRYMDGLWRCSSADSYALLKQSINNTYSKYCDRSVLCVTKESSHCFQFFQELFENVSADRFQGSPQELEALLSNHLQEMNIILRRIEAQKVNMSWTEYQQFVWENVFFAFSHYKTPDELNASRPQSEMKFSLYSYLTTSNYAVKYIGKTIRKNMLHRQRLATGRTNWRINYVLCPKCGYGYTTIGGKDCPLCSITPDERPRKKAFCAECGILFNLPLQGRPGKYCPSCYPAHRKNIRKILEQRRRERIRGQK